MSERETWDSLYDTGNFGHWEPIYPSPELAALIAARVLKKNYKILDAGCGGGLDAIFLAKCGFKVVGVDFSKSALRIAERRSNEAHVEIDWRLGSAFNLPIENETIDFVTDRGLFHVIKDLDRPKYSSELFRVLKFHGLVCIRGASKESSAQNRFNPITEEAIDRYFPKPKFERGPILPIPLFSSAGSMDARIVILKKVTK